MPIVGGLRPWGSIVEYAGPFGLRIGSARGADSGVYDCIITHPGCGSVTSATTGITICAADVDDGSRTGRCDGAVGIEDLVYFLIGFEQGDLAADLDDGNGNGLPDNGVDINDLLFFLMRFEGGC